MAIIERPGSDTAPAVVTASQSMGAVKRPVETKGWKEWLFTVDHKKIGIMYGVVAMFFFIVGGIEALLIRLQLAAPNGTILSADQYNQITALSNYITELKIFIGAFKDVIYIESSTPGVEFDWTYLL